MISLSQYKHKVRAKTAIRLICWIMWLLARFVDETTLRDSSAFALDALMALALLILLVIEALENNKYKLFDVVVGVVAFILLVSAIECENKSLLWALAFIYLLRNVDFRILMLTTAITITCLFVASQILVYCDFLRNIVFDESTSRTRLCLGFIWPSRAGNYILTVCLAYICAERDKCKPYILIIIVIASFVVYYFTDARNPHYFTLILVFGWIVFKFFRFNISNRLFAQLAAMLPAFLALLIIVLTIAYDPTIAWMSKLNDILTNRLLYSHSAFVNAPPSIFGSDLFNDAPSAASAVKGFLDSGYLRLLLTFGIAPFAIIMYALCRLEYHIAIQNDKFLFLCVTCILLRSLVDGGFVYLQLAPMLFILINNNGGVWSTASSPIQWRLLSSRGLQV